MYNEPFSLETSQGRLGSLDIEHRDESINACSPLATLLGLMFLLCVESIRLFNDIIDTHCQKIVRAIREAQRSFKGDYSFISLQTTSTWLIENGFLPVSLFLFFCAVVH